MGGVGKTTLARLLYDDKKVKDHFELNAWVCVSDEFDSFNASKVIFQSVTGVNKEFADLNLLQVDLRDHPRGEIFLLVLDDIWIENYEDWVTLVGPLHACAPGSKIIITTRKEQLLKKLGYRHLNHRLQTLSPDDALSLLALLALGVKNFDSHLSLKKHGEGIVKKCDGLPLALIALGRLLRTKQFEEEYWKEVLNNEIWRLQNGGGIIPALRLSYHDLSSCLKQLFIYCSLFPKDYMFEKEELVLLWMTEGFLHQSTPSNTTEEQLGHEYFDELLSRSFFQHAPNSESLFVMHDLMNDLATSMAS
ncbi:putative P-loop containing nucleoside triphosphate hydrolase [Helianthus annuus]|nr:putative P-loop containing nucleoside triphosphate hydrolase [Helianthus annuus]KAJ0541331.1 putative P-loop containing nucleoside triphosphate hydrolase [Helianthus annuus]KAJ0706411.1 putative P-loop containing nucleoside triphosphate hydrolase [Helianthus annuus]KAJ0710450.1 putative P-loop containing nucleoside triphosphate hydrolase [Helianthus annuus]KAJ0886947.1 putative P-loop containing nucleoside triphosphate hydrolase [Helianthus annuus]